MDYPSGTITTTGNVGADSATLSGYYVRRKDSSNTIGGWTTRYQNSLKQNLLSLTNIGTSGAATLVGTVVNIPIYPPDSTFAKNNLTATGNRIHDWATYDLIVKNSKNISMLSDTFRFKTRITTVVYSAYNNTGSYLTGSFVEYGDDTTTLFLGGLPRYSDAITGTDSQVEGSYGSIVTNDNGVIVNIERRYTFDSLQLKMQSPITGSGTYSMAPTFGQNGISGTNIYGAVPAIPVLHDKYLNTYTTLPRSGTSYITFTTDANSASRGKRFTVNLCWNWTWAIPHCSLAGYFVNRISL